MGGTCAAQFTRHVGRDLGQTGSVAMIGPSFSRELRDAAAASRVVPRLIAERPPEWRLGPLTLLVDARTGKAQLRYARLAVARAPGDAGAVMSAWTRALGVLSKRSLAPDTFLPLVAAAYAALLERAGHPPGERVALPELREQVIHMQAHARYTRAQFAFDLARLRRERRLVHEGRRIDLGVATGHATARSRQVVWVEDESGAGQYYQTFRMLEESPR